MNEQWAVVELMGHVRVAGRVSEEERYGAKVGRIDVPQDDGTFVTQLFGGGSVYRITFVSEDVARVTAKQCSSVAPVGRWDFPKQLPERIEGRLTDDDDYRQETIGEDVP